MLKLPLYPGQRPLVAAIELAEPLDRDSLPVQGARGRACDRCVLGKAVGVKTVCIADNGMPGGLLVVGEGPGKDEDRQGLPFVGVSGRLLKTEIAKSWPGPVAFSNATRCRPGTTKLTVKMAAACRGYLAQTLKEVQPQRIITVGAWAAMSLFGRSVAPLSSRRAYCWLRFDGRDIPVAFVLHPAAALRNRFVREWFEGDLRWALKAEIPRVDWNAVVHVVETQDDARAVFEELYDESDWIAFDVEAAGTMWSADYTMISCAVSGSHSSSSWVWSYEALNDPAIRKYLIKLLTGSLPKVGSNVKYDQQAFRCAFGVNVAPIAGDARLYRKLLDAEASGYLSSMSELIGMGGLKEAAAVVKAERLKLVRKALTPERPRKVKRPSPTQQLTLGGVLKPTKPSKKKPKLTLEELDIHPDCESALIAGLDLTYDKRVENKPVIDHRMKTMSFWFMDDNTLHRYNGGDAVSTGGVVRHLRKQLVKDPELLSIWNILTLPSAVALERVESWGTPVSVAAIQMFDSYLAKRSEGLKTVLDQYRLDGKEVNWASNPQLAKLLFERLKLPVLAMTKGGKPSTAEGAIGKLRDRHPLPGALLDYRSVEHIRSTYTTGMVQHVRDDGRIHPNIKVDGTRTGRVSCVRRGTLVDTVHRGRQPIEDIRVGELVWALDGDELAARSVTWVGLTGVRRVVRVRWRCGENSGYVDLTPDHLVRGVTQYLRGRAQRPWLQAQFTQGESLVGWEGGSKVRSVVEVVEDVPGEHPVYDLTVAGAHNFFAGGICTHNCTKPNLMNIPKGGDEGKMARDCFVASPGFVFVDLDYGQLEFRVAAMLSQDKVMIDMLHEGVDIHLRTAQMISEIAWGIGPDEVTKVHRQQTKSVVFGCFYGKTPRTFAEEWGVPLEQAEAVVDAFFGKFRGYAKWSKEMVKQALKTGEVRTWWDGKWALRRSLYRIADQGDDASKARSVAKNGASNTPIQGCQPASTRVLTRGGYLRLGDAPEVGEVWTGTSWAPYRKLARGEWELAELDFANGATLRCDTRHEVLVAREHGYEFVKYSDLVVGDRVCCTLAQPIEFGAESLGEQTAYWMGFAAGNGSTQRNGVNMTFGDRKGRYRKEEKAREWERYGYSVGVWSQKARVSSGKITIGLEGSEFRGLWESFGYIWGKRAPEKRVPCAVWSSSLRERQAFLIGLLDADGTVGGGQQVLGQPNVHLCQRELLQEVQILARACGVESKLHGPYGPTGSHRLDFNSGQLADLGYGLKRKKMMFSGVGAPRFLIEEFLKRVPSIPKGLARGSFGTLHCRFRAGGTTGVYQLRTMLQQVGVELDAPIYAWTELARKRELGVRETTYTLSVADPMHRFDSEGIITKNTATGFCMMSMTEMVKWIVDGGREEWVKLCLPIYDELLHEVHEDKAAEVARVARDTMLSWNTLGVPFAVDCKVGKAWGSLRSWDVDKGTFKETL